MSQVLKRLKRKKLRKKLILIVILASIAPILIFFLINTSLTFMKYRELLYANQKEKVSLGAYQISAFIEKVRNVLLTKTESFSQNETLEDSQYSFRETLEHFTYFNQFILFNEQGKPIYGESFEDKNVKVIPIQEIPPFQFGVMEKIKGESLYFSPITYNWENVPLVNAAMWITRKRDDAVIGVISSRIDLSHIQTIIKSLSVGRGQNAFIVDGKGNILMHSSGKQYNKFDWKSVPLVRIVMERTWDSPTHKLTEYLNSDGIKVVGVVAHIKGTQWGLILEQPVFDFFSMGGINFFFWISFSISIIVLLICILLAYRSFWYLLFPLDSLFKGVEAITSGNLKYRLDIKTGDEIEDIAESFNRMVESLEEQRNQRSLAMEELNKKKRELEVSNIHLKEASRLRSEFLTNMSHELRTPMNTIIGFTSIILDGIYGELNEKQQNILNKVLQNSRNLSQLINDILDLSKLESGKMPIFKEHFIVSQVIKETLQPYKIRIEEKHLELKLDLRFDTEIESDRSKIKQVLDHLFSNAIKFTRKGSITILTEKSPGNDFVKISVIDTGIGISEENQERVFDEFRQLDGSFTREFGGTGLGLSIAKKILKILDAKITVKSKLGEGSNFTIYIPFAPIEEKVTAIVPEMAEKTPQEEPEKVDTSEMEDITKKLILSVDDDPEFLEMMKDIVKKTDFRVITARSVKESLEIIKKVRPHLITCDILMPEGSGWDLIKQIKSDSITLDIPIFVISIMDEKAKAYSMGVSEYFVKPIDRVQFLRKLHIMERSRGRRILVIDDDHIFLESFFVIMREHSFQITTCDNGKEGLQKIRSDMPDVIVLDLMMPEFSGYDIIDSMEKEGLDKKIPVIMITAKELSREELESLKGRVFSIVRKTGITREELSPKIRSILERIWCEEEILTGSVPEDRSNS